MYRDVQNRLDDPIFIQPSERAWFDATNKWIYNYVKPNVNIRSDFVIINRLPI